MNTRDMVIAAYEALHMLSYPGEGGVTYLGWGVPTLGRGTYLGVPHVLTWLGGTYLGYPPRPDLARGVLTLAYPPSPAQCERTENITFPDPSNAVGKNDWIIISFVK